jgi:hypothetical protein
MSWGCVKGGTHSKEAARSENPDRARHVSTSLRELYTHIVHRIAPDSEVQSWTSESSHFHNGRPTRKARLLYVCRHLNHGPFETFVQKDVAAALGFLDLFQMGTHDIVPAFSATQLSSLIQRMEGLLRFLLETSKAEKGDDIEPTPEGVSFLRTARSLDLDGPPDWAANIDKYLYGGESSDED